MSSPMRPIYRFSLAVEEFLLVSIVFPVWSTVVFSLIDVNSNVLLVDITAIDSIESVLLATLSRTWSRGCRCLRISTRCEGITCGGRRCGASCLSSG